VINPIALQIGTFQIHWYGIIIATAVLVSGWLGGMEARRRGENPDTGWAMLLPVLIAAVIAARLYHVIHEWGPVYSQNPALIPQIWNGGLGIPGAVAGGVLAIWLYTRWAKLNTLRWFDIFASVMLLGQAIGRLGNFVNQELYGPPTSLPWGIPIDAAHRIGEWTNLAAFPVATRFHPLFAYEALLNLVGFVFILWIGRRLAHRLYDGDVLMIYLMWYAAVRTWLETFRVENWVIAGVPTAIWLGVITFIAAGAFLWLRHARGWGVPGAFLKEKAAHEAAAQARPAPAEATEAGTEPSPG
jgi:phosphatidylglycerol:prolipoprotein diacylglycerol transferase